MPDAAPRLCPIEAVLPDGHHPCTLERGHRGIHDFDSDPLPDATPPRPLTAPDVVAGLLADVAAARAQLAGAPEVQLAACPLHDGQEHVQIRTWGNRMCVPALRGLDDGWRELEAEAQEMRAKLAETLAANQRWAETLGDVQQRHAEVKRERDAHKLRADHYEGLWRAEHGLPPDGTGDLARDRDLAASVRAVIARYRADDVNALTAFADIVDAFADSGRAAGQAAPTAVDVPALMKDHVRLGAELRELTGTHETLLEEILRNADEDINGGDEAAEYLAEAYVRFLEGSLKSASDERDKLSGACGLLARTLSMYVRSLYATWIDAAQHRNLTAVIEVLAESLDGFDGPEWDGSETGTEWLERTRGADVVSEALSENEDDGTETASVLADPETMAAIAEGDRDA